MLNGLLLALALGGTTPAGPPMTNTPPTSYLTREGIQFITSAPRPVVLVNDSQARLTNAILGNVYTLAAFNSKSKNSSK